MGSETTFTFAILGAGRIVPDAYLSVAKMYAGQWMLGAIWSRTAASIDAIMPKIAEWSPDTKGLHGNDGLEAILADPSVQAVMIALPAQAQIGVVKRALAAGKHVLEEKPIGATLSEAADALKLYRAEYEGKGLLWALAENYRSEGVFLRAREVARGLGKIVKIDLVADMPMTPANKYFSSEWRRDGGAFYGGFIADSAPHYLAALRTVAQAAGVGEVVAASARCSSASDALPPPDTAVGVLHFATGESATLSFSFAAAQVRFSLSVVGTRGSLEVRRGGFGIGRGSYSLWHSVEGSEPVKEDFGFTGFETEIAAFAEAAQALAAGGKPDASAAYRISCVEGVRDQAIVDALFRSSASGGAQVEVAQF